MVDSLLNQVWQRPWTRIFGLSALLGSWFALLIGCTTAIIAAVL
jgi:hypothetical protein